MTLSAALSSLAPGALVIREPRSVVEFAESMHEIVLGGAQGLYSKTTLPHQADILEDLRDPKVRRCTWLMASQGGGKTTMSQIGLHYFATEDPGPALWVLPDKISRDYFVEEQLKAAVEQSRNWSALRAVGPNPITKERACFHTMTCNFAISKSSAQLAQKSVRYLFLDEIDKYPEKTRGEGSPLRQAEKRVLAYSQDYKIIEASTPTTFHGPIWKSYKKSSQHEWHVPCPVCEFRAPWEWGRIDFHWKDFADSHSYAEFADLLQMREVSPHYICGNCGAAIEERWKTEMNQGGLWIAKRPEITWHIGRHAPALVSPFTTMTELGVEWFRAQDEKKENGSDLDEQDFVQHRLARPYQRKRLKFSNETVESRCNPMLPRGVVPADADILGLGVDVQASGVYWYVLAGRRGQWIHTVDEGFLEGSFLRSGPNGEEIWLCEDLLLRTYTQDKTGKEFRVLAAAFDSGAGPGDDMSVQDVYRFCRMMSMKHRMPVVPVKGYGVTEQNSSMPGGRLVQQSSAKDAEHEGTLMLLDVNGLKDLEANWIGQDIANSRASYFADAKDDERLLRHMASEERVTENGKTFWKHVKGQNHLRDAGIYALAILVKLGLVKAMRIQQGKGRRGPQIMRPRT